MTENKFLCGKCIARLNDGVKDCGNTQCDNYHGYIPYSKRNNITDPDLAGLLDYLERVMGWDISMKSYPDTASWFIFGDGNHHKVIGNQIGDVHVCIVNDRTSNAPISHMPAELFFRTYKTLLPVIRDLYSN